MLDAMNQLADLGDLGIAGCGFNACPIIDVGRGENPFTVCEETVEVGAELGQERRISPEVSAPNAAHAVGAGGASRLHV